MRCIIRLAVVLGSIFSGLQMAPASAEKRVALVIGNGSYAHIAGLPNVPNDAAAMAALFKAAKFDAVDVRHNLGVGELRRALKEFASRTADADVAVLFYAGHGIEVGQVNYLIPVDARLVTDYDVEDEAVPLDRALQAMEPAKRLRLAILDACRENPFARTMKRTVAARSVGRGLGRVEPSMSNTLIAFATKPHSIAEDGKGPNSPFTAALVKHLLTPGLDLRIALGHVRDDVLYDTGNKQEPYVTGSLGGGTVSVYGYTATPAAPTLQPQLADAASRKEFDAAKIAALLNKAPNPQAAETKGAGHVFRDCPDCPEMVVVPAGEFMMGSSPAEIAATTREVGANWPTGEGPQRRVNITAPLAVSKFRVRTVEWDACRWSGVVGASSDCSRFMGKDNRPAEVSWHEAKEFTSWLSRKTGKRYRLLSEAEWEYAARATNNFGLSDMLGGVTEWVEDNWHRDYQGAPRDGSVWPGGETHLRVVRGGRGPTFSVRPAYRTLSQPDVSISFRVARNLD